MAADSHSMSVTIDRHLYLKMLLDQMWFGPREIGANWRQQLRCGGGLVTDAKSLYDHLGSTGQVPTERQTMLDLLVCKDLLAQKAYELFWVPTYRQFGNGLTKKKRDELWEEFCKNHTLSLKETPEEQALESHRQSLRRGQRQRRKVRYAKSGTSKNSTTRT